MKGEMNDKFGLSLRLKLSKNYNYIAYLFYSNKGMINKEFCETLYKTKMKMLENSLLIISLRKGDEKEAPKDKFKE